MPAKNTTKRSGSANARTVAEDLDTIREVYERHGGVSRSDRWRLSANINHAVKVANLKPASWVLPYPEKYEQAEKALVGSKKYGAIEAVHWSCEQIRKVWNRPEGEPSPRARKKATAEPQTFQTRVSQDNDRLACFGLLPLDVLTWERTSDVRRGDIISYTEVEGSYIGRVVVAEPQGIVISNGDEDFSYDPAAVRDIARLVSYTRTVELLRPDPATEAAPADSPAQVIDLMCYRQAHPRAARNLLFAEKQ